jgi:osmotically inducible lipoprotein OsmB
MGVILDGLANFNFQACFFIAAEISLNSFFLALLSLKAASLSLISATTVLMKHSDLVAENLVAKKQSVCWQTEKVLRKGIIRFVDSTIRTRYLHNREVFQMNTIQKLMMGLAVTVMLGLTGCAGMSTQDKNTAIGAGVGAVGGSVLTSGNPVGAVGGAVVGGVIGHEIKK